MSDPTPMKKASDFHPEVLRLFDQYVHGGIDRRGFLDGAKRFTAGGVGAVALLEALSPKFAQAQQVKPDDARIRSQKVEIPSPQGNGKVSGLLVRPAKAAGKLPLVLVAHENRGLNPHIEDIARRLALADFVAFAPDALFTLGGYPGDEDKARELFGKLDGPKTYEDFVAAANWLRVHPEGNGKLGVTGFCWGGGIANFVPTRVPEVVAAAPFYGPSPAAASVPSIKATLLVHLADNDERINAMWPAYEAALKAAGTKYEMHKYPGTQHGFNNDTTPRYDKPAADLAWKRTIDLFNRTLRA